MDITPIFASAAGISVFMIGWVVFGAFIGALFHHEPKNLFLRLLNAIIGCILLYFILFFLSDLVFGPAPLYDPFEVEP